MFWSKFHFLDTGPLVDGELELVAPSVTWLDTHLQSANHPLCSVNDPDGPRLTREQLAGYLAAVPGGRMKASAHNGHTPQYEFWMLLHDVPREPGGPPLPPLVRIGGVVTLRVGSRPAIERYYGHFGYHVYAPARGHHYAERAVRLLLPLARRHGLKVVWITCNPLNHASRRTCERLAGSLVETVRVPPKEPLYARGERWKNRYRIDLSQESGPPM